MPPPGLRYIGLFQKKYPRAIASSKTCSFVTPKQYQKYEFDTPKFSNDPVTKHVGETRGKIAFTGTFGKGRELQRRFQTQVDIFHGTTTGISLYVGVF